VTRTDPDMKVSSYLKEMTKAPDGISVIVLTIVCLLLAFAPGVWAILNHAFGIVLPNDSSKYLFLLFPPALFGSLVWLNAFTKTSRFGVYVNAAMIIGFALLLFFGTVHFN
jgi:hypothetical protein